MSDDGGLRPEFRKRLPDIHWQSIETGGTGLGVPDSNFCLGVEGWIEFKWTDTYLVPLRPEQIGWLTRRARSGGRVFVGVRRRHEGGPRKGESVDELWMLKGAFADIIRVEGLRMDRDYYIGAWGGGPSSWPWPIVRSILLGN